MLNVFKSKKFRFLGHHARYLSTAWKVAGTALPAWLFLAFATGTVFAVAAPAGVPADTSSDHDGRRPGPSGRSYSSS